VVDPRGTPGVVRPPMISVRCGRYVSTHPNDTILSIFCPIEPDFTGGHPIQLLLSQKHA
jgi:hypothetical protein